MSERAVTRRLPASHRVFGALTAASYGILGSILCLTRFTGLDRSYWHDEIVAVEEFVRAGPREILAGPDISHELFGLLAWATSEVVGESEIALRLWSVVPFILGVIVVTVWLHIRVGRLSGVLFLFFATCAPLLLDITRQARGYGLAFFAMCVVIVAALEADRSRRTWTIVALCAAGAVGTWTLPNFGIAFVATGAVLLMNGDLRRRAAIGLTASIVAIGGWYAPHFNQLQESSRVEYGVQIDTLEVPTAPIDQILIPALLWIDGKVLVAGLVWLPLVGLALLLIGSSPLVRMSGPALILTSGVIATVLALWVGRTYVVPRYLSFLLVPLFILLASGTASVLTRIATRPPVVRTVVALTMLGLLAVGSASPAAQVTRLPREAHKDAAELIERRASPASAVLVYAHQPVDLAFYLDMPVQALETSEVVARVCDGRGPVVYVVQPFVIPPVDVPCLRRTGVRQHRFRQYTRGDEINVWFVPPRS